ncbi:MAG: tRNA (guanosine(37)-N1)-methyltransferase TrmD [Anaerorhabdus sp.]
MKITILTLFPEMFTGFLETSIIARAQQQDKIQISCVNIRDYSDDKHRHVDDTPFGGGQGMVLQYQPLHQALVAVRTAQSKVFLMAPTGQIFKQAMARKIAQNTELVLICGHYEGVDARILDEIDGQLSIGDYVLTGGELASMVVVDAVARLVEGVITEDSHLDESFENGLLEYPQYTKPAECNGKKVPEVLLSGHHENIRQYRLKESLRVTYENRPDLLDGRKLTVEEEQFLREIKENKLKNE